MTITRMLLLVFKPKYSMTDSNNTTHDREPVTTNFVGLGDYSHMAAIWIAKLTYCTVQHCVWQ